MNRIALKMLFGRPGRYAAMIVSTSFAVMLITQQSAIFLGTLVKSTGPLQNIADADVWVTSRHTRFVEIVRGVNKNNIQRLHSIRGVAWAMPLLQLEAIAELPDGTFVNVAVMGIDRNTFIGRPPKMISGRLSELRSFKTVVLESSGRRQMAGVETGGVIRINEHRARVVGVCEAKTGILSKPLFYTSYQNAARFSRFDHNQVSWVLVKLDEGASPAEVCREINDRLGLAAFPAARLRWDSMRYIMFETSIGISFLVTILLGFLVGLVVSAATFGQFTADCLAYFAVLKATGVGRLTLFRMVAVQGMTVGLVSYGIGLGLAALFSLPGHAPDSALTVHFSWQLLLAALVPMVCCIILGSTVSLWHVYRVDPMVVFQ